MTGVLSSLWSSEGGGALGVHPLDQGFSHASVRAHHPGSGYYGDAVQRVRHGAQESAFLTSSQDHTLSSKMQEDCASLESLRDEGETPASRTGHRQGSGCRCSQGEGPQPGNRPGAAAGAPGNSDLTAGLWSLLAQALTIFQRSLTTMQIQVAGLLQFAVPLFPTAEVRRPPPASVREEGEPQARAAVSQDVERVPPCSLAPSLGFTGLCAPAAVCRFAHQPWSHLSVSASLHVGSSLLPASERSAQNPAPVELLGVQPSPADSHVGLPGAAQGAGVALGGEWGAGTPQLATCSHRSQ